MYIEECDKLRRLIVRLENMLFVLNCVEALYIIHDILSTSYKTGISTPYETVPRAASVAN